jgi:hypothetical protein
MVLTFLYTWHPQGNEWDCHSPPWTFFLINVCYLLFMLRLVSEGRLILRLGG